MYGQRHLFFIVSESAWPRGSAWSKICYLLMSATAQTTFAQRNMCEHELLVRLCIKYFPIWFGWPRLVWPQPHPASFGKTGASLLSRARSFNSSAQPHLCSRAVMWANPCSQIRKSSRNPSQKRGGCFGSGSDIIFKNLAWVWCWSIDIFCWVSIDFWPCIFIWLFIVMSILRSISALPNVLNARNRPFTSCSALKVNYRI